MFEVDYRRFRLSRLNDREFRHIKLLFFWPVFYLLFQLAEHYTMTVPCHEVRCFVDSLIPFSEGFLLPYLFWFAYVPAALLYTFLFDVNSFKRMMGFIMLTYSVTLAIYFIFPNCQTLRPQFMPRNNILTRFIRDFYAYDTNTDVCPSLHVLGAMASMFALNNTALFRRRFLRVANITTAVLICLSTVFIKQHSIVDVIAAEALAVIGYMCFFRLNRADRERGKEA